MTPSKFQAGLMSGFFLSKFQGDKTNPFSVFYVTLLMQTEFCAQ